MIGHTSNWSFFNAVLLANGFQLILSSSYYLYNGLLTCMVAAAEISRHGLERKPLRVSEHRGIQRSTFFFSLPYRYGLPCTICSGLLHWLISQSIFLVRTTMYNNDGSRKPAEDSSRVGFSPIGLIMALSLAVTVIIARVALGLLRRYPGGKEAVPITSTHSGVISVASHRPPGDTEAHLLPVQWGAVFSEDGLVRCSFTTARDVEPLMVD